MALSTSASALGAALALAGLGAAHPAQAQTAAPAWRWATAATSSSALTNRALATDAAGNSYVAVTFRNSVTLAPGTVLTAQTGTDAYVAKYSPAGALLWVRQLTGTATESVAHLAVDAAGTVWLTGDFVDSMQLGSLSLSGKVGPTSFLAHLDAQGQPLMLQELGYAWAIINPWALGLDAAGNVYLSGSHLSEIDLGGFVLPDTGFVNIFLIKYSAQGVVQWVRQGGSIPSGTSGVSSYAHYLTVSPAGDCYLSWAIHPEAGGFGTVPPAPAYGDFDVTLVRYDTQGTARWQRRYGTSQLDYAGRLALDGSGHLLATMSFPAAAGTATVGSQTLTGSGQIYSALLQLDALTGNLNWVRTFASDQQAWYRTVAADATGNVYVGGSFMGTTTGSSPVLSSTSGGTDAVVASYSPQGTLRWAQKSNGPETESTTFLSLADDGELTAAGYFTGSAQLGSIALTGGAPTVSNFFLARFGTLPTATKAALPLALAAYPNPATDLVRLPALAPGTSVQLFDALGRLAREATVSAGAQVAVQGLRPGLYTLRATNAQGQPFTGKVVIE